MLKRRKSTKTPRGVAQWSNAEEEKEEKDSKTPSMGGYGIDKAQSTNKRRRIELAVGKNHPYVYLGVCMYMLL